MNQTIVQTPVGAALLTEQGGALIRLVWGPQAPQGTESLELAEARHQLAQYFAGERRRFELPLRIEGSGFLKAVCAAMLAIPFGQTRTYGEIGAALGAPAQAVGQACAANPLPIVVPCHRVLGADGLGGYSGAGGIETKVVLLRHEGAAGLLI